MQLYKKNALQCSKTTTINYSTSFSMGIKLFKKKYRMPIYAIYGFVRFADEIVDTFHDFDQKELFNKFKADTWEAINNKISTNPILHSFQQVVNTYNIDHELIEAFLKSMEMDLFISDYNSKEINTYIYGSAEVVGLMCLRIFYMNNDEEYNKMLVPAQNLGKAFQKVNFLRDIADDYINKGRLYFPGVNFDHFTDANKLEIVSNIKTNFVEAYKGIKALNKNVRLGVLLAYVYYKNLLIKIEKTPANCLLSKRYSLSNKRKIYLFIVTYIKYKLNIL